MKLATPICPHCQTPAVGARETIPITCPLDGDPREGSVRYGAEGVLNWDQQQPVVGPGGQPLVTCVNGHLWETQIDYETWLRTHTSQSTRLPQR